MFKNKERFRGRTPELENYRKDQNRGDYMTEDEKVFGKDHWVYCNQHLRPHLTGWCTVDVRNKVGLGIYGDNEREAYQKCRDFDLKIFKAKQ